MSALTEYIAAWVTNDPRRIAACVAQSGVVTECYGPVYRGRERVQEWAEAWFAAGGIVHAWTITDHFETGNREAAQWAFDCTFDGTRSVFDGCTVSTSEAGLVVLLREYQTTAELYDWTGRWRD